MLVLDLLPCDLEIKCDFMPLPWRFVACNCWHQTQTNNALVVSSYTCAYQYSAIVFKFLSLSSFLLFIILSGELSVAFCSFWTPSNSFSLTHEVCWTLPGFFLYCYPGMFLRQWAGAIIGLILFISCPLGIFVLHSLMPIVLKIVQCICPLLQMGGKSFLCYSILSRCLVFCWCFLYFCCYS